MDKIEQAARDICIADGVDPDQIVWGMGYENPKGWSVPFWVVRANQARADIDAALKED